MSFDICKDNLVCKHSIVTKFRKFDNDTTLLSICNTYSDFANSPNIAFQQQQKKPSCGAFWFVFVFGWRGCCEDPRYRLPARSIEYICGRVPKTGSPTNPSGAAPKCKPPLCLLHRSLLSALEGKYFRGHSVSALEVVAIVPYRIISCLILYLYSLEFSLRLTDQFC